MHGKTARMNATEIIVEILDDLFIFLLPKCSQERYRVAVAPHSGWHTVKLPAGSTWVFNKRKTFRTPRSESDAPMYHL